MIRWGETPTEDIDALKAADKKADRIHGICLGSLCVIYLCTAYLTTLFGLRDGTLALCFLGIAAVATLVGFPILLASSKRSRHLRTMIGDLVDASYLGKSFLTPANAVGVVIETDRVGNKVDLAFKDGVIQRYPLSSLRDGDGSTIE